MLVLIESAVDRPHVTPTALKHLGTRWRGLTGSSQPRVRFSGLGLATASEEATTGCYDIQDKVWVEDPDGAVSEVYVLHADAPDAAPCPQELRTGAAC